MLFSLLTLDSPATNAKMEVAAIKMLSGTKNTPAQWRGHGAVRAVGARARTHQAHRENGRMRTEAVKREVAGSKLVLHEGALADLGQHRGGD